MINSYKELKNLLFFQKGLLFHSVSIVLNKQAFLFSGISGSGKTTFAKKMVGFVNIINDDRNLLVLDKKIKVCMPEFLKNLKESHYFQNPEIQASLNRFFILKQENIKESYIKKIDNTDIIWKFLFKVTPMPKERKLLKNYYNLIDVFSKELNAYYFFHNLKGTPNKILEIIQK